MKQRAPVRRVGADDDRPTRPLAFEGILPLAARQTPTSILALQRTVGNTAARLVIQRSPDQGALGYKRPADLRVGALLLGPALREDMDWIERQAQEVEAKRPVLDGEMESLHIAADVNGPAATKEVGALRPAVAGLGGARKEAVKQAIDHYIRVQPQLRATMLQVEAQRKIIVERLEDLRAAVAHKKGEETKREEGKAQKELDDLNENKNKTNEMKGAAESLSLPVRTEGRGLAGWVLPGTFDDEEPPLAGQPLQLIGPPFAEPDP